MKESSNALIPPMEWENFQKTVLFRLLRTQQGNERIICRFFCADSLVDLEDVPNPIAVFHTRLMPFKMEQFIFRTHNG